MSDHLQEYVDSRGAPMRVDRAAAVIRGVKILGLESRNARSYLPAAMAAAATLYEGIKVNVNHAKPRAGEPRDYQDRIGLLRGVTMREGAGLFGDLHYNPKHALAEQLLWDAEHASENVGLSHNVLARTSRRGEQLVVPRSSSARITSRCALPLVTMPIGASGRPQSTRSNALARAKASAAGRRSSTTRRSSSARWAGQRRVGSRLSPCGGIATSAGIS